MKTTFAVFAVCCTFGVLSSTVWAQPIYVPQTGPYTNDAHTVLLEHFDGATSGSPGGEVTYTSGIFGQGVHLGEHSWVSWNLGALPEASVEFWGKVEGLDPHWYSGGIGVLVQSGKGELFSNFATFMTYILQTNAVGSLGAADGGPFTNVTVALNTWHHYATTWGGQGFHFYLDGALVYSGTNTAPQNADTQWWAIGGRGSMFVAPSIVGAIDELRISDIQRTFSDAPAPSLSIAVSKVKVTRYVVVGHKYVLESSVDLAKWTQVGEQFTATEESVTQEFDVDEVGKFFRIREVL